MNRTHILAMPMRRRANCYAVSLEAMATVCRVTRAAIAVRPLWHPV